MSIGVRCIVFVFLVHVVLFNAYASEDDTRTTVGVPEEVLVLGEQCVMQIDAVALALGLIPIAEWSNPPRTATSPRAGV